MLVELTDTKGRQVWINPIHVKAVRDKSKYVEVVLPHNSQMGQSVIKARGPVEDIVRAINAGMPEFMLPLPPEEDESHGGFVAGSAAGIA